MKLSYYLLAVSLVANIVLGEKFFDLREDFKNKVFKWNGDYYLCQKLKKGLENEKQKSK